MYKERFECLLKGHAVAERFIKNSSCMEKNPQCSLKLKCFFTINMTFSGKLNSPKKSILDRSLLAYLANVAIRIEPLEYKRLL